MVPDKPRDRDDKGHDVSPADGLVLHLSCCMMLTS